MTDPAALPPLLLPRPAQLSCTHPPARPLTRSSTTPTIALDHSLPTRDAYRLTIAPPAVSIAHRSPAGLRHARATLAQLGVQYGDRPPALEILDHPAIAARGVMLDISRDRIPTMAEFARVVTQLASLKLNHLQLNTEHAFAYAGHQEVWGGWDPVTHGELLELQTRCAGRGIELAANQNCFGHLSRWLEHPRYAHLAETHGEWVFDRFTRSGPFSLCPGEPGSIELVRELLGQLLPLFESVLANVGCDETYDIGQGRSAGEVARRGKAAVYFDFVDRVFEIVRSHGKRPMFWADVALNHPESIGRIAGDAVALAWGYEADTDFDRWCEALTGAGKSVWVCPGTSSWRSITGRTSTRRANLRNAAGAAARYGLGGYLVTDWGDSGHRQVWPLALVAIAEGADRAWNAGRPGEPDPRAISLHCFGDRTLSVASWLDELGDIDLGLRGRAGRSWFEGRGRPLHNASVHFADLAEAWGSDAIGLDASDFEPLLDRLSGLRGSLPGSLPGLVGDELTHTLDRAELACRRAVARRHAHSPAHAFTASLLPLAEQVGKTHAALWLHRSRPGLGLEDSLSHDQRVVDELRSL